MDGCWVSRGFCLGERWKCEVRSFVVEERLEALY